MSNEAYYHFKLGDFKCISISDGGSDYAPGSFFANVSKQQVGEVLRAHSLPADNIWTPYTYLFVDTGEHKVLVDMGAGSLRPTTGNMIENMKAAAVDPGDIDTVLITHAHPDHIGGTLDEEGKPVYTNARYFIWKREWEFWFSEDAVKLAVPKPAAERFVASARRNLLAIQEQLDVVDPEAEILPGVSVIAAPGHTPGHMVVSFSSGAERLLYTSDTVLHPLHLAHPDRLPIFDILPDEAAASKRRIFDLAAAERTWVIGQHFSPFPSLGHVVKEGEGWNWQPVEVGKIAAV